MTINLNFAIKTVAPDVANALTLTACTRSDDGQTPAGLTLPTAFDWNGNSSFSLAFTDASPPPFYNISCRIGFTDGTTADFTTVNANSNAPLPAPPSAEQATAYAYAHDGTGAPVSGRRFFLRLIASNSGNDVWDGTPLVSTASDDSGLATATVVIGASYQASADGRRWSSTFTVPNAPQFHVAELVGCL